MTIVNARLLADTIYCEETEFSYTSRAPNITVPFAVIWGGSKPLDNPHNIHLVIYRCRDMADNCGMCLTLAPKYDCGWCQSTDRCEVKDNCERNTGMWLNSNQTCPNPEIHSFEPVMGPWEGNTNVTIRGINLGQTFMVRKNLLLFTRELLCSMLSRNDKISTIILKRNRKGVEIKLKSVVRIKFASSQF